MFAYLLWLFGVMFPNSHGDVVLPGLIYFAAKIVDEPLHAVPTYSFGSAILSHTYRGLCDATQKPLPTDSLITWNPWTELHNNMVFGSQPIPVECVRDSGFWMTRCNLLCLWFVEPYNPDRVMRQFGLHQDIPPPVPRCIDEHTHK